MMTCSRLVKTLERQNITFRGKALMDPVTLDIALIYNFTSFIEAFNIYETFDEMKVFVKCEKI